MDDKKIEVLEINEVDQLKKKSTKKFLFLGSFIVSILLFLIVGCAFIHKNNKKYLVKFDTLEGTKIESVEVKNGEKVSLPEPPQREGYEFVGWYVGDKEYDFNSEVNSDIVLIARWEKDNKISIKCLNGKYTGEEQVIASCSNGTIENEKQINAGEYIVKCSNENESIEEKCFIKKADLVCPTITEYSGEYDGKSHMITVGDVPNGTIEYKVDENEEWVSENPSRKDEGITTVYVRIVGDDNYDVTECGSTNISISKKTVEENDSDILIKCQNKKYNGEEQVIASCINGTILNEKQVNAGEYTVKCSNDSESVEAKCKIEKASIECPYLVEYNGRYDGNAHTIKVGNVVGGTLEYRVGTDGEWTNVLPDRKDVGLTTVYVRVVGDDNHITRECGSSNIQIKSSKKNDVPTPVITCQNKKYNGSEQIIASCQNGTILNEKQVNAGEYTVKCSNDNELVEAKCSIEKVDAVCPVISSYNGKYDGESHTIKLNNYIDGTLEYRIGIDGEWTRTLPSRSSVGTTIVYVRVASNNYNGVKDCGSADITINTRKLFVIGDSVSASYDHNNKTIQARGIYGWGEKIGKFYSGLEIVNLAVSGASSRSYVNLPSYQTLLDSIEKGDYLLIAFGHNDESPNPNGTKLYPTFTPYHNPGADYFSHQIAENGIDLVTNNYSFEWFIIEKYIKIAQEKGAYPILSTPITRMGIYDCVNGKTTNFCPVGQPKIAHHINYTKTLIDIGRKLNVPVLNLTCKTYNYYNYLLQNYGVDAVVELHSIILATSTNSQHPDGQHLSDKGSDLIASMVAEETYKLNLDISRYLNSEYRTINSLYDSSVSCLN